tara:strand:- start:524 stop:1324 length:801 start_codon:yes stop_codon:yes gene_type:complete
VNKKFPLISIVMNCYNGEKYLNQSLNSIFKQTYKNWELIFWDNLSYDNSKKIIEGYKDKRIRYFKSKKFQTLYSARNLAIKKAKGKFICFLDTDDWWKKDKIQKQVRLLLDKEQKPDLIYSNYYFYNQNSKKKKIFSKEELPEGKITQSLLDNYCVGLLTIFVKKKLFMKKRFNKKYNIIGDFDFVLKVSEKSEFACIQEPLANYRIHGNNYLQKNLEEYINEIQYWINKNKTSLEKKSFSLKNQLFLLLKLKIKYHFNRLKFFNF